MFKLQFSRDNGINIESRFKVRVNAGGACDVVWPFTDIPVSGNNFDAGSGLWISPKGKDRVAVLATEHYNSCGAGKSRWGVTGNWDY